MFERAFKEFWMSLARVGEVTLSGSNEVVSVTVVPVASGPV